MKFKKILLINIFGIGDVLFTTPFITQLKSAFPDLFIGYLANRRTAPVLKNHPKIDRVYIYERDEFDRLWRTSKLAFMRRGREFLKDIRSEGFDTAVDFSLNSGINFLIAGAGIPRRLGYNFKNRSPWLTLKFPLAGYEEQHVVVYYNDLLRQMGIEPRPTPTEIPVTAAEEAWAEQWLLKAKIPEGRTVFGVVPGGGASWGKDAAKKRWAPENYAKLADKLVEMFDSTIILVGDEGEADLCAKVASLMTRPAINACGQTTIGQFAALARRLTVMIVNDGGPLHMAVAAGARTVSLFGPVDERVYGPYAPGVSRQHAVAALDLSCRPCYRRFRMSDCAHGSCLKNLTVEEVLKKVESLGL